MTTPARLVSIGALALFVMAPSWNNVRPVLILATDLAGGGCEFKVGEDANSLKKHFRRSAKKDEPIVWQIENNCSEPVDVNIVAHEDAVTFYGGTNGFLIGTVGAPRSFQVRAGEGAFGLTLNNEKADAGHKKDSICVEIKGNKCPEDGSDVKVSKRSAAARRAPGPVEAPRGGEPQVTRVANVRYKRAQVQIDIFP